MDTPSPNIFIFHPLSHPPSRSCSTSAVAVVVAVALTTLTFPSQPLPAINESSLWIFIAGISTASLSLLSRFHYSFSPNRVFLFSIWYFFLQAAFLFVSRFRVLFRFVFFSSFFLLVFVASFEFGEGRERLWIMNCPVLAIAMFFISEFLFSFSNLMSILNFFFAWNILFCSVGNCFHFFF